MNCKNCGKSILIQKPGTHNCPKCNNEFTAKFNSFSTNVDEYKKHYLLSNIHIILTVVIFIVTSAITNNAIFSRLVFIFILSSGFLMLGLIFGFFNIKVQIYFKKFHSKEYWFCIMSSLILSIVTGISIFNYFRY